MALPLVSRSGRRVGRYGAEERSDRRVPTIGDVTVVFAQYFQCCGLMVDCNSLRLRMLTPLVILRGERRRGSDRGDAHGVGVHDDFGLRARTPAPGSAMDSDQSNHNTGAVGMGARARLCWGLSRSARSGRLADLADWYAIQRPSGETLNRPW
jgi:hypothetical protein